MEAREKKAIFDFFLPTDKSGKRVFRGVGQRTSIQILGVTYGKGTPPRRRPESFN